MKTIFVALCALFAALSTFAQTPSKQATFQHIDCHLDYSDEHVIVSLNDTQTGTFFYTLGLDSEGNDRSTRKLVLTSAGNSAQFPAMASFKATFKGDAAINVPAVEFEFLMPKDLVFKASDYFPAALSTDGNLSTGLFCMSRIYSKN